MLKRVFRIYMLNQDYKHAVKFDTSKVPLVIALNTENRIFPTGRNSETYTATIGTHNPIIGWASQLPLLQLNSQNTEKVASTKNIYMRSLLIIIVVDKALYLHLYI